MWLGIDFGTCNSSAVLMRGWVPSMVEMPGLSNTYSFPTCVYVKTQTEIYVGHDAYKLRLKDSSRYKEQFKRDLGRSNPYYIGAEGHEFMPEDLVVKVIQKLKTLAEHQFDVQLTRATIAVPASHTKLKRQLMVEAGKKAGFTEVDLVDEPVAAAVYYAQRSSTKDGEILLVYDLGGGTFDVALIQRKGSGYNFLTPPLGDPQCGGIDFDRLIFEDFKSHCNPEQRKLLEGHDSQALRSRLTLNGYCRSLKENLSFVKEDSFSIPLLGAEQQYQLTRADFQTMIAPHIEKTVQLCQQIILNARLSTQQIDRVLLVGGSCQIPYVREIIERALGRPVLRFDDPDLAVCRGSGVYEGWNSAHEPLQAGIDSADVGNHLKAIEKYNSALQQNSKYAKAYVKRSEAYSELGHYDDAINDVKMALRQESYYADAYVQLGDINFRLGNYQQSINDYNNGLKIYPNIIRAYLDRGRCFSDIGDKAKSIESWKYALKITPQTADDFTDLGWVCHFLDDNQRALIEFKKALELNHRYVNAYVGRSLANLELKDYQASLNDLNQALKLNSNSSDIYGWRGIHFEEVGDIERAIADFDRALNINPNYMAVYYHRGRCRSYLGNFEGAIQDFNQALRVNPNDAASYSGRGSVYAAQENYQQAMQDFSKALQINPNLAITYLDRGNMLFGQGDYQGALKDFNQTLSIDSQLIWGYVGRGFTYLNLEKDLPENKAPTSGLQLHPTFANLTRADGTLLSRKSQNRQAALTDFNQALQLDSKCYSALYGRGLVQGEIGNHTNKRQDLQQAAKIALNKGDTNFYQQIQEELNAN